MAQEEEQQLLPFMYCNKIDTKKLKLIPKGKGFIFEYKNDPDIFIHLPEMRIPFNVQEKKTRDGRVFMKSIAFSTESLKLQDTGDNTFDLEADTKLNNKHIKKFVQFVKKVDSIVEEYFDDKKATFYNSLYCSNDNKYSPTFSVNVKFKYGTNEPQVDVYDDDTPPNILMFEDRIFRNKIATGIVRLDGAWKSNGKIGLNWTAVQLQLLNKKQVQPKQQTTLDFNIQT